MSDREASTLGAPSGKATKSKNSESPKEAKKPQARLQLHVSEKLVERLGVHCSLLHKSWSDEASRILLKYLVERGRGRQLFKDPKQADIAEPSPDPVDEESASNAGQVEPVLQGPG